MRILEMMPPLRKVYTSEKFCVFVVHLIRPPFPNRFENFSEISIRFILRVFADGHQTPSFPGRALLRRRDVWVAEHRHHTESRNEKSFRLFLFILQTHAMTGLTPNIIQRSAAFTPLRQTPRPPPSPGNI
jgi:hypothetical protein